MAISTKTGDDGTTGLLFNRRVPKDDPRVEAYGTVDELVSALGVVRASVPGTPLAERLQTIQRDLMIGMSDLAVLPDDLERYRAKGNAGLSVEALANLEAWGKAMEAGAEGLGKNWAVPGDSLLSAHLHVARAICRRSERRVATLRRSVPVDARFAAYLNRLSDILWLAAREAF